MRKLLLPILFVVSMSTNAETDYAPIYEAISHGNVLAVRDALNNGMDPNLNSPMGYTPLQTATLHGEFEVAKLLLEKGAFPDPDGNNINLTTACANGYSNIVELLISNGANPNKIDSKSRDGMTCLMRAVSNEHFETVKILLRKGADATLTDHNGNTAFDISQRISFKQRQIRKFLDSKKITPADR